MTALRIAPPRALALAGALLVAAGLAACGSSSGSGATSAVAQAAAAGTRRGVYSDPTTPGDTTNS